MIMIMTDNGAYIAFVIRVHSQKQVPITSYALTLSLILKQTQNHVDRTAADRYGNHDLACVSTASTLVAQTCWCPNGTSARLASRPSTTQTFGAYLRKLLQYKKVYRTQ